MSAFRPAPVSHLVMHNVALRAAFY